MCACIAQVFKQLQPLLMDEEPTAVSVHTLYGDSISAILVLPGNREGLSLLLIVSFLLSFLPGQLIHVVLGAQLDLGLCYHMSLQSQALDLRLP